MFEVIDAGDGRFIKAWKKGVFFEDKAVEQLKNTARLPFVRPYVAAMPDTHWGMGATVGSVVPTERAICPATVGVDIGCGMIAIEIDKDKTRLGDLALLRKEIERVVPCGRTNNGGEGDRGAWHDVPENVLTAWDALASRYEDLCEKHPKMRSRNTANHLGTLGTGNHFIELSEDETGAVWLVLHSGSRGIGNRVGTYFTQRAKELCEKWFISLPDADLAYLPMGTPDFQDYILALQVAQEFAWLNRCIMVENIVKIIGASEICRVHCHHNYVAWENHAGKNLMITRKGAVRARKDDLGIIPGSMGASTYIVRGLGNPNSFHSCSHGAGRAMSRTEARKRFTVADHERDTLGVECHKGAEVIDETPLAYKDIDAVMAAQTDLVEPVHVLKQFLCVKGLS